MHRPWAYCTYTEKNQKIVPLFNFYVLFRCDCIAYYFTMCFTCLIIFFPFCHSQMQVMCFVFVTVCSVPFRFISFHFVPFILWYVKHGRFIKQLRIDVSILWNFIVSLIGNFYTNLRALNAWAFFHGTALCHHRMPFFVFLLPSMA